jgi:hypothetical protein
MLDFSLYIQLFLCVLVDPCNIPFFPINREIFFFAYCRQHLIFFSVCSDYAPIVIIYLIFIPFNASIILSFTCKQSLVIIIVYVLNWSNRY